MGLTLHLSVAHSALFTQHFLSQTQKQHLIPASSNCLSLKLPTWGFFPSEVIKAFVLPLYWDNKTAESLEDMNKKLSVTSRGMNQNLGSPWGPLSLNFASKPSQRSRTTPTGSEGEASIQPLVPCWAHPRLMDLSEYPWEIFKSKLLTTGRAEVDLNMENCKMSWSLGRWGAELCSDPLEWRDQRGLHCAAPQEQPAWRK